MGSLNPAFTGADYAGAGGDVSADWVWCGELEEIPRCRVLLLAGLGWMS